MEKLYRATDLKRAILKEEPQFIEKIEFMNLWTLPNEDKPFITPDLRLLSSFYGQANDFLHVTKRTRGAVGDEAWTQLYETLVDTARYLVEIHSNLKGRIDLNKKGQDLFDKVVSGDLSIDEVRDVLAQSPIRKA